MTDDLSETAKWDADEPSLLFNMWLLQQALTPLIETAISRTGLSADEYGFYLLLTHLEDATPGDIARMTGMRPNTTSAALARLEKRGHLIRTPNDRDRRSVLVRLSPAGLDVVREAIDANQALNERLLSQLDAPEIRRVVGELEQAVRAIANMPARPDSARSHSVRPG